MSMLAERKKKTKWVNPGRQALWKQDAPGMKYGRELMEKMGWKIGQGLGLNNQGITEPLKISLKNDNKGMGYKGSDNEWIQQQSEFDLLLNKLSSSEPLHSKGTSKDSKTDSVRSLEERSKLSKARLQYNKFTRGKDFTKYSEKDIECIIGCKKKDFSPFVGDEADNINCMSHVEETGLITVNSGSMMDYFAKKMQSKTDPKICFLTEEQNSSKDFSVAENKSTQEKELKKNKKSKRKRSKENSKECINEELYFDELVLNDLNNQKVKSVGDEKYDGIKTEDNPEYLCERNFCKDPKTVRKNLKDKSKEPEKQFSLNSEDDALNENVKEKKKKRKKNKCNEELSKDIEQSNYNEKGNENNEGHSGGSESFDLNAKENGVATFDADEEPDVTNQRKKKKKKKRVKETENTKEEEEEEEEENVKKKKVKLDDFNVDSDAEGGITRNQNQKCMEKPKLTPNTGSLYKTELLKTSNSLKNNQQNKILNLIYCMNTEKFNGSNLGLLNGYGIIRCKTES